MGKRKKHKNKEKKDEDIKNIDNASDNIKKRSIASSIPWKNILSSLIITILVFSPLSYAQGKNLGIIVPFLCSFILSFIIPQKKHYYLIIIILTVLGNIFYSHPPTYLIFKNPLSQQIQRIIYLRQVDTLTYSPPLLIGLLGSILGWGIASIIIKLNKEKYLKIATYVIFIFFCINFIFISIDLNPPSIINSFKEPKAGNYNNYNSVNLKAFYLMKRGDNFYNAYSKAYTMRQESFGKKVPSISTWRTPTLFYLWKFLLPPEGFYIFYLYLLISIGIFYMVFDICRKYLYIPLNLVPIFLISYLFLYGSVAYWFTFPEFWGISFLILGLWGIHKNNKIITIAGYCLSVLIHPLYIISWFATAFTLILDKKRRKNIYILIPGVIFLTTFLLHYRLLIIRGITRMPGIGNIFQGDAMQFIVTFNFGSVMLSWPLFTLFIILILFIFSTILLNKTLFEKVLLAIAILPPILFVKLGPVTYRDYWGIIYLPFLLIMSCLSLNLLKPQNPLLEPKNKE